MSDMSKLIEDRQGFIQENTILYNQISSLESCLWSNPFLTKKGKAGLKKSILEMTEKRKSVFLAQHFITIQITLMQIGFSFMQSKKISKSLEKLKPAKLKL
jgi:hypothetical protein